MDFKHLPPCQSVLRMKIERTNYLAGIIKSSSENYIGAPKNGWFINENGELEMEYFSGNPYPEIVTNMSRSNDSDSDEEFQLSSEDEDETDGESSDDDWNTKK